MDRQDKVAPPGLGEAALRDLVDAAFDALVITHAGNVVFANRSFAELYGAPAHELVGMSMVEFVAPESRALVFAHMSRPEMTRYEAVGMRRDGSRIEVEICAHTGTYENLPVRISAIRVITERKLAEQALRRSEAQLRLLIERIRDAIVVEREGSIVFANAAALQYVGYANVGEVAGMKAIDFVHPGDRASVLARLREAREALPSARITARIVRRDGSIGTVELATASLDAFDGGPANVVLARDITERQQMEARLVQTNLLSSIGMLAAGIAHEINNPLAYVTLNLGVMARKLDALRTAHDGRDLARAAALSRELEDLLAITRDGADRVQRIVHDVRVFARGSGDTRAPVALPLVLDSTIQLALNSIRHRAQLVREYEPVPLVAADEPRLGQLFLNLLINALQAFDDEPPTDRPAEIRVRTATAADGAACIEITDTGRGIAAEMLGRVFEPFFTTKPPGVGTGLGLPICRSIVNALGGTIEIQSELGRGTTCRVTLPALARAATAEPAAQTAQPTPAARARLRVLVVDDEPVLLRTLGDELGQDHEVTCVASGAEAIAHIRDAEFDVVLCDVMMPAVSGIDVLQAVRRDRPELEPRIIFMTGGAFTPTARSFLASVSNAKLEKPFTYEELMHAIAGVG
ncbi:MAG TPA: PAS domain S-box protein [Kofleriaceae bacterium]|nr:PAS domain S-box protein [Kofleriaceae bacterium]